MGFPKVTVLMAVYNGEKFLRPSIESVLSQTYADFEFLIIDDASSDGTLEIINSYKDPRIRIICNEKNQGTGFSRNKGILNSKGEYIAVLDADDIMYPERIAKQVLFLDEHPEIVLIGGAYDVIDQEGRWVQAIFHPTESIVIRWKLLFNNPIATSTTMFRKYAALEVGGYDQNLRIAEDYAFYVKLAEKYLISQIREKISAYRINTVGLTSTAPEQLHNYALEVSRRCISSLANQEVERSVVSCYQGRLENGAEINMVVNCAYELIEDYLKKFLKHLTRSLKERRLVFDEALNDLRVLADLYPIIRFRALIISFRVALFYTPVSLLTIRYFRFILGTIIPLEKRSCLVQMLKSYKLGIIRK